MGTTSSGALVRELLDLVWNEGDLDAAERYVADGYTVRHDPGDPWEGQRLTVTQYVERVGSYRAFFPDQRFTVHELLADNHKVMVTWSWQGTAATEPPGPLPPGTVLTATGATVYYVEEDKITGHWQVIHRPQPSSDAQDASQ